MAIIQNDVGKRRVGAPLAEQAGSVMCARFEHTFTTNLEVADVLEFGVIPFSARICDITIIPENLNGNATIGVMTGDPGDATSVRTIGSEILAGTALASAVVRQSLPAAFLLPASDKDRAIGMTTSAQIAAAANKKITVLVLYTM